MRGTWTPIGHLNVTGLDGEIYIFIIWIPDVKLSNSWISINSYSQRLLDWLIDQFNTEINEWSSAINRLAIGSIQLLTATWNLNSATCSQVQVGKINGRICVTIASKKARRQSKEERGCCIYERGMVVLWHANFSGSLPGRWWRVSKTILNTNTHREWTDILDKPVGIIQIPVYWLFSSIPSGWFIVAVACDVLGQKFQIFLAEVWQMAMVGVWRHCQ